MHRGSRVVSWNGARAHCEDVPRDQGIRSQATGLPPNACVPMGPMCCSSEARASKMNFWGALTPASWQREVTAAAGPSTSTEAQTGQTSKLSSGSTPRPSH